MSSSSEKPAATRKKKSVKKTTTAKTQKAPTPPRPDAMDPEVIEFLQAVDKYKRDYQCKFPTLSQVFEIVRELGYHR